jgi:protein-S-isoprenylcysteine O-methyltransferase Ste14
VSEPFPESPPQLNTGVRLPPHIFDRESATVRPLPFTWPLGLAFWTVWLWAAVPEMRILREARRAQRVAGPAARDRSLRPLLLGQQFALLTSMLAAALLPAYVIDTNRPALYGVGVAVIALASLLRRHCFRMLGTDFQGAVSVRPNQSVIERGAYRYLRHPSYTAGLLLHLGVALSLTHWVSLLVALIVPPAFFLYRIRTEERALEAGLGESYTAYMARTKRLIPGVW